jgi:D-beta-D-heptose 7-phosphate kinase/D-beta-D-heptose 1-phosphate adenosyltransferase
MFRYGRCERLSPEAPVPIFLPKREYVNGGMALNVADNIESLGVKCDLITNDIRPMKTRLVDEVSNQIIVRIDENDKIREITMGDLRKIKYSQYDAVVISDYDKGFLSEDAIEIISQSHELVFMDSKKKMGWWSNGIDVIKVNHKEFLENAKYLTEDYAERLGTLVVTMGKDGAVCNNKWAFPIEDEHPVRDLSGAGDTFLAGLVVEYIKNNDIESAIRFANKCASWVVTQKGVVAIDPTQI